MKNKKLIVVIALVLLAVFCFSSCAGKKDEKKLTMVTNLAFPPYEYMDGDEQAGIDVEIAKAVCAKMGYGLEIVDMEFGSLIPAVSTGKADFTMAGLTVTEERKEFVAFSITYATGIQSVIVPEGSPITCVDDLFVPGSNWQVGVQQDTTGDIYTTGDIEDAGLGKIHRFSTGNDAIMALTSGKIDCVVIDNAPAKAFCEANPGLVILDTNYAVEDYAAAFALENTELQQNFNTTLQALIDDGTVAGIINKYIPVE